MMNFFSLGLAALSGITGISNSNTYNYTINELEYVFDFVVKNQVI